MFCTEEKELNSAHHSLLLFEERVLGALQQHRSCASSPLVLCRSLTGLTGHCLTLPAAGGWLDTTGYADLFALSLWCWQSQQGSALPRQETATREQLGYSGQWLPGLPSCG